MSKKTKLSKKRKDLTKDELLALMNVADLTAEDIAKITYIENRTVRNQVKHICEKSSCLTLDDFKIEKGSRGKYNFKAEWNGLFTLLIDVYNKSLLKERKDGNKMEHYVEFLDDIIKNIDKYLKNDPAKDKIKEHMAYKQALLEKELYERISSKIDTIVAHVQLMPPALRFRTLQYIDNDLSKVPENLAQKTASYLMAVNMSKPDENKDVWSEDFFIDLEGVILKTLEERIKGKEEAEDDVVEPDTFNKALLQQVILGNLDASEIEPLKTRADELRDKILQQEDIANVFDKVKSVLSPDIATENIMLQWIENTSLLLMMAKTHKESYRLGEEMLRRSLLENEIQFF